MSSTERPNWAPDSIDLERPNAARIYDYLLGGAANFAADREFGEQLLTVLPEARGAARMNRAFLHRAVRFCVDAGIRQFLDVGSGIPTAGNVHEIAQRMDPSCRVLYVDIEPVAVTHSELMLRDNDRASVIRADFTDPDSILDNETVRSTLDFDQPMALLLVALLHFVPDAGNPHEAVSRFVSRLVSGSYLVLSHSVERPSEEQAEGIDRLYDRADAPGVRRPHEEIAQFYEGLEMVEPGLVNTPEWRPEPTDNSAGQPGADVAIAGVARKP
ncbi:MAG TPA: SAM-dependent methyltransferase [Actinophytocola sp.]|nr:SAM-dependent methyltransferase [Actinophytocola sp.]